MDTEPKRYPTEKSQNLAEPSNEDSQIIEPGPVFTISNEGAILQQVHEVRFIQEPLIEGVTVEDGAGAPSVIHYIQIQGDDAQTM